MSTTDQNPPPTEPATPAGSGEPARASGSVRAPEDVVGARNTAEDSAQNTAEGRARISARALVGLCAAVVVAAAMVRLWVAGAGWFYWDDLILHGLASGYSWPSPELLLTDHDGHLMPGGMLLAWIAAHAAPLDFRLPLVQIVVLQLLAGVAYARMLWVLLRGRPVMLVPLIAGLVIPLGLPAATWWASALNVLPLIAALAWAVTAMVQLARTGHRRHAVWAAVATIVGLLFVEKALIIPVVAAAVLLAGWWTAGGGRTELLALWRTTRVAWAGQMVIVAGWVAVFVVVVGRLGGGEPTDPDAGADVGTGAPLDLPSLAVHTYRLAVLPTLGGGPWRWERWQPGPPLADPPVVAVILGALAVVGVLWWSLSTRRRTGPIWLGVALYPLVLAALVFVGRAGPFTAAEIVQTLRYHAELPVILGAALALVLAAPRRSSGGPRSVQVGALALVALVVSSAVSTVTYRQVWAEQPSRDYTLPLLESLRERTAPILDQDVPLEVLLPLTRPANQVSSLIAGVPGMPEVGQWTTEPVVIDGQGRVHAAEVVPGRMIPQGPEPECGFRVGPQGTRIELDGPLLGRPWVVQLNLLADAEGQVAVRLDDGQESLAPVDAGLGTVFVSVEGGGTGVSIAPRDGVSELCVGSGPVGVLVPR